MIWIPVSGKGSFSGIDLFWWVLVVMFRCDWSWLGMVRHEHIDRYGLLFSGLSSVPMTRAWDDFGNDVDARLKE